MYVYVYVCSCTLYAVIANLFFARIPCPLAHAKKDPLLVELDEETVHDIIRMFDIDKDHRLSYTEFLSLMLGGTGDLPVEGRVR